MQHSVSVRVPASTANIGPGFDCLGMALDIHNTLDVYTGVDSLQIEVKGSAVADHIPRDHHNLVHRAMARVFEAAGEPLPPLHLVLGIEAPLARGLGSSASAIVAGMSAANELVTVPLSESRLLYEMAKMEGHPDNVAACALGGLVVSILRDDRVEFLRYEPSRNLSCILVIPIYELSTARAREAVPRNISMKDAVFNLGRVPFVIDRLVSGDLTNLADFMDDRFHQPYRKDLIQGFDPIISEAEQAGAAACLSGAGPTILVLAPAERGLEVAGRFERLLSELGIEATIRVTRPDLEGAVHLQTQQ